MEHRSQQAFMPSNIAVLSFKEADCLRWAGGWGVPFQPQSLTVVPLNINWHPGTSSTHSPLLAPYVWMEHDILALYAVNVWCVNGRAGVGFVLSSVPGNVHTVGRYAPRGDSGSPCFTETTGAVCPQTFICRSPISGCRACCGSEDGL